VIEGWFRDCLVGLRSLRKSPVFALTAVLTLAIGIGANTAVFTLLYGLLLRSLPVRAPGELAYINMATPASARPGPAVPIRMIQQLRQDQRSFVDISSWIGPLNVTIADADGTVRHVSVGFVSGNGFELFGLQPHVGRLLTARDDVRGGPAEGWPVVLSHRYWIERFAGDPSVIGKPLRLSNAAAVIVGVTPPAFHGVWPGTDTRLYAPERFMPVAFGLPPDAIDSPTSFFNAAAIARLKPGVSLDEANAEISAYAERLLDAYIPREIRRRPGFRDATLRVESARTGLPTFFGFTYSAPLYLMQALVAVVLLLCCVNVSGLLLSKVHQRQHEFAVRRAIGAPAGRLVRQYLTESFILALAGAALAAIAAWNGSTLLLQFFRHPNMGTWMSVRPDHTVFAVTAAFAVLTTLFFGTVPALRAGRTDPGTLLKARTTAGRRTLGRGFVTLQVALSMVLVALATLLSQSLVRLRGEDTGFDLNHVTIQTPPFHLLPQKGDAKLDVYQRMVDAIEEGAGIESAAVTWYTPMTGSQATARAQALAPSTSLETGREGSAAFETSLAYNQVGPGYFRTMEIPVLEGREFEARERTRDVCVLNRSAAQHLFPKQHATGRYVSATDPQRFPQVTCRVVGVVGDAKFASLREPPPPTLYHPVTADRADGNLVFLMNSPTKAQTIAAYRDALQRIAPTIPLVLFATLREQMDAALGSQRAITFLSAFFGGVALLLSAIGLYGMLSTSVTQRTGEIGVRVAIGASRTTVLRMILSDAMRLVALGVAIGGIGLLFAVRWVEPMLYGVAAFDAATLAGSVAVMMVVALLASSLPALRAASIDPMQAMRTE
jgi:predicted permease